MESISSNMTTCSPESVPLIFLPFLLCVDKQVADIPFRLTHKLIHDFWSVYDLHTRRIQSCNKIE
jgi:hypothetical protein